MTMSMPFLPRTASELDEAVRYGVLVESTNVDFKERLDDGSKANLGLAKDLAAFSVQGGLIVVGVAEVEDLAGPRLELRPVVLAGLKERVSNVGTSRVSPAVALTTRELEASAGEGYLLILIPASPAAPHQVDGRYLGRADSTNYVLTDADVRRIQAERRGAQRDIGAELDALEDRDLAAPSGTGPAHLFLVARPELPSSPTMLQDRLGGDWQLWLREEIVRARHGKAFDWMLFFSYYKGRPDGWAAVSHGIGAGRVVEDDAREASLLDLEVDEDGRLRLTWCGATYFASAQPNIRWAFWEVIAGLTWPMIRSAASSPTRRADLGNWDLGVAITNAQGMRAPVERGHGSYRWAGEGVPFAEDDYRMTTVATYAETSTSRGAVLNRLVGRLNRALNAEGMVLPDFDAP